MSDEYKKQLGNLIESNPYEALFKASEIYKNDTYMMLGIDNKRRQCSFIASCVEKISLPDEKVLMELISLESEMDKANDPMRSSYHYVYEVLNKNPSLLDSALDYFKDNRYPEADTQLLRIAIEKPEEKPKIFSFLRDYICDNAENCSNMVRFAYLSENEEIKNDMIKKLRSCEAEINGWKNWSQVASLTGDGKHCEKACNALREELQNDTNVSTYNSIGREIDHVISKDVRKSLSEELFYSAEISVFRAPKDGYNYLSFNNVARIAIHNSDDVIPDVMSALKREVRDTPKKGEISYNGAVYQMESFYNVLTDIIKKRPETAKEAFSMCKNLNKARMGDERHPCNMDCSELYYDLLENLADADKSLKPEITSIVRENIRRNKELLEREVDYGGSISLSINAGKKVMQKLTTPEKSGSELQRS